MGLGVTTLGIHEGRLLVRHTPNEMTPVLSVLPGVYYDGKLRAWSMPPAVEYLERMRALFPNANEHKSMEDLTHAQLLDHLASKAKTCPIEDLPEIPVSYTEPWSHQLRAFWFLYHKLGLATPDPKGGALLAMDMGTGKTKVSIDLIQNLPGCGGKFVLVTCPLAVVATWPDEVKTHWAGSPVRVLALSRGSVAKRAAEAKRNVEQAKQLGQTCIVVINHESVWRPDFRKFVLSQRPDLLIVDECHRAKSPGGQLSKFLGLLHNRVPLRIGLTGTPMPRDHMDIYAQARFLDQTHFGTSAAMFQARYGQWVDIKTGKKDKRGKEIVAKKLVSIRNKAEMEGKLDRLSYRVMADDVLDLPPAVFGERRCVLDSKERAAYEEFKRELLVQLESGYLSASNGLTKLLRLQQIVQGYVEDDDGNVNCVGTSKKKLLKSVLEDLDKDDPVVVFCKFHTDLDQVADVAADLERGCLELSGRVNQLEEFKKGGGPIIAVQIQSGGVGVDLSRAKYSVYFSPTYDMGAYEQSLRRTRRPTKHRHDSFFFYHLVAEGTVDAMIYRALRSKKNLVESVLQGIKGES